MACLNVTVQPTVVSDLRFHLAFSGLSIPGIDMGFSCDVVSVGTRVVISQHGAQQNLCANCAMSPSQRGITPRKDRPTNLLDCNTLEGCD